MAETIINTPQVFDEAFQAETTINCTFCGAKFVTYFLSQNENNTDQVCYCPECSEEYLVQATSPIPESSVQLLSTRLDGREQLFHSER